MRLEANRFGQFDIVGYGFDLVCYIECTWSYRIVSAYKTLDYSYLGLLCCVFSCLAFLNHRLTL